MSSGSRGPATAGARVLGRRGRVVVTRDDGAGGPSLAGQAYASSPFTLRGKTIGSRYVYLTLISQARPRCCWPTVRPRRSTQRSRRSTRRARPRAAGLPIPSGAAQDRRRQRQPSLDDPQRTHQGAGGIRLRVRIVHDHPGGRRTRAHRPTPSPGHRHRPSLKGSTRANGLSGKP